MTVLTFLDQTELWGGNLLDHMDPDHRSNLIPFLRGNARTLYRADHGLEPDATVDPSEVEEWLEHKPLMRRLVELEQGRSIDARRATHERNVAHERATGYQKVRFG